MQQIATQEEVCPKCKRPTGECTCRKKSKEEKK